MIIDTDILIWYLRGNEKARSFIEKLDGFKLSVVSYMELVQGLRNKAELHELRNALSVWQVNILLISETISAKAMFYVERYYLSHSITLADALIAATAVEHSLPLHTGNDKHFCMIKDVDVRAFRH